jgi:hypothetical protein
MNGNLFTAGLLAAALLAPAGAMAQQGDKPEDKMQQGDRAPAESLTDTQEPNPIVAPGGPVEKPGPETYPPKTGPRSDGEMMKDKAQEAGDKAKEEMKK